MYIYRTNRGKFKTEGHWDPPDRDAGSWLIPAVKRHTTSWSRDKAPLYRMMRVCFQTIGKWTLFSCTLWILRKADCWVRMIEKEEQSTRKNRDEGKWTLLYLMLKWSRRELEIKQRKTHTTQSVHPLSCGVWFSRFDLKSGRHIHKMMRQICGLRQRVSRQASSSLSSF